MTTDQYNQTILHKLMRSKFLNEEQCREIARLILNYENVSTEIRHDLINKATIRKETAFSLARKENKLQVAFLLMSYCNVLA